MTERALAGYSYKAARHHDTLLTAKFSLMFMEGSYRSEYLGGESWMALNSWLAKPDMSWLCAFLPNFTVKRHCSLGRWGQLEWSLKSCHHQPSETPPPSSKQRHRSPYFLICTASAFGTMELYVPGILLSSAWRNHFKLGQGWAYPLLEGLLVLRTGPWLIQNTNLTVSDGNEKSSMWLWPVLYKTVLSGFPGTELPCVASLVFQHQAQ